ncbi:MAG: hypothetical protein NC483_01295 [Ruminococcus sp.]|nr:hypothetical protein [Ruminococcus sp.]
MNYKNEIKEKTLNSYSDLLSDIIYIYYKNKKDISKKDILMELLTIRELKRSEVDTIFGNAIELVKVKYSIDISKNRK